jgi:hypothetical protein
VNLRFMDTWQQPLTMLMVLVSLHFN